MQLLEADEIVSKAPEFHEKSIEENSSSSSLIEDSNSGTADLVVDISGKSLEFPVLENAEDAAVSLYMYKNDYSLIPKSLGDLQRLRTLKFFGNEIQLFPPEFGNLTGLECLQLRVSSPAFSGLPLHKLNGLKELELSKVPPRPSALPLLSEIAGLKCLTKLSVCHFSIRYLPPEIGFLKNLEQLDLSFNKLKRLPYEISYLNGLISLKVANNKLVELPSALSSLQRLENLDLSNNRLTSLGSLELDLMQNLQNLNLRYNRLLSFSQIPSWMCFNMEGNGKDAIIDDFNSFSVQMDVYESTVQESDGRLSHNGSQNTSSSVSGSSSSNSRSFASRKTGKRWKRRYYLQQKARQERLNNSRKWKGVSNAELLSMKTYKSCKPGNLDVPVSETCSTALSGIKSLDDDNDKKVLSGEAINNDLLDNVDDNEVDLKTIEYSSCNNFDSAAQSKVEHDASLPSDDTYLCSPEDGASQLVGGSYSEVLKCAPKPKRHSDRDLDNPKPCKSRKPTDDRSKLSRKYRDISFCSIEDHLRDGFYDAGRDRPFMPLDYYEQNLSLGSREVILFDRKKDEELDAIMLSAQAVVFHLKQLQGLTGHRDHDDVDSGHIASLLALFVSDHFGGSDRSALVERTRKSMSGSNYQKPFVCTCSTGRSESIGALASTPPVVDGIEDIIFSDICEKSLHSIKARRNSIIVPIGTLQFGVCRHRALLMKYLCDHMEPPVPCELVRGYLDFVPHAWNTVLIKRGDIWVRMLVDACRPHDIREESDPEYICRYIPNRRISAPLSTGDLLGPGCSFPSVSSCVEIEKAASSTLVLCKFGSVEAAAKLRTLEVHGSSTDEIRNFEYGSLGEVRILGALKHPCIVEMYGHQISCKWALSDDGNPKHRVLQSVIFLEYVKGGSLKSYLEKLSNSGEKHVPVELALCIARDVACALTELHSKHIIHRDIKSENILIDLDKKRDDGTPTVKLCDFDRAVPLRSFLHTCCIAHTGIPATDVCVGTPPWMAPEVMHAMYKRNTYGLEVDIWSFGCLLLELLTLQVPYSGLRVEHIHDLLQMGKRPRLTEELEALGTLGEPAMVQSGEELEISRAEVETLRFLVDLFYRCTDENPINRPTAEAVYQMVIEHTSCSSLI
ncbi:Mitogen-activated protein kinase kinase kinase [Quillaja saponaria]|uniref:Mitogen-activated protein kinase kinase kinase n=1 Tax=Quillaja saponaria TaxID=32244 RepID=A0AAD7QED9_QUISA|nr:Mitogen-activated protein kinase kinase kinase [Quillaja saponaria]